MKTLLALIACLACTVALAEQPDPISAEMSRHNAEMSRLIRRTQSHPLTQEDVERMRKQAEDWWTSAPASGAGTTCDCSVTGRCTCDPALCRCPSCLNGRTNAAATAPRVTSYRSSAGSYAAATNLVDRRGRRIIQHSDDKHGRKLARHTAKAIKLGLE